MCRMFAYSGPPRDLREFLVGPGSLEALAAEHGSGWGLARWRDGQPVVRREPVAADNPKSGWRDAVREAAKSPLVLAHLRRASVGRVSDENTHPFERGRWAFAHNGTVRGLDDEARRAYVEELEPGLRASLRGTTDSELVFHMFLERLLAYPERLDASVDDAAPALVAVARRLRREHPGTPDEPTATTLLAGNGEGFVGYRWGRELSVLQGDGWAVLASEPVGPASAQTPTGRVSEWRAVPEGALVLLQGGVVRVRPQV